MEDDEMCEFLKNPTKKYFISDYWAWVGGESYRRYLNLSYHNGFSGPRKTEVISNFTLIRFKDIELTRRSTQYSLSDFQSNTC